MNKQRYPASGRSKSVKPPNGQMAGNSTKAGVQKPASSSSHATLQATKQTLANATATNPSSMRHTYNNVMSAVPSSSRDMAGQHAADLLTRTRGQPIAGVPQIAHPIDYAQRTQQLFSMTHAQQLASSGSQPAPQSRPENPTAKLTDELTQRLLLQLLPSMRTVLNDNQTDLMRQMGASQNSLRLEMARLREDVTAMSERAMKREDEDKQAKEREVEQLKALKIMADRMGTIQKGIDLVADMIGKSDTPYGPQQRGMLQIMEGIEMDLLECLEKARDPTSNGSDNQASAAKPSSGLLTPAPSVATVATVRHEMATSPIMPVYVHVAVCQTPPPMSLSPITRATAPGQVTSSFEVDVQRNLFIDLSPSGVEQPSAVEDACDVSPDSTLIPEHPEVTHIITEADVAVPAKNISADKGAAMNVDEDSADLFTIPTAVSVQPFIEMEVGSVIEPSSRSQTSVIDPLLTTPCPPTIVTPVGSSSRQVASCNVQEQVVSAQRSTRSKTCNLSAFSPVDWEKALATSSVRVGTRSLAFQSPAKSPLQHAATTPSPTRTYSIPAPAEGTIAALRQQALGEPYLLNSTTSASRVGSPIRTTVIAGAAAEAAERMLSPESQTDTDSERSVEFAEPDAGQRPDESLFTPPVGRALKLRSPSVESSLTSISSHETNHGPPPATESPNNTPPDETRHVSLSLKSSLSNSLPSQSSSAATDEDTVRFLLEDLSPVKTTTASWERTATVEWLEPTELLDTPRRPTGCQPKAGLLSAEPSQSDVTVPPNTSRISSLREWHSKKGKASTQRKSVERENSTEAASLHPTDNKEANRSSRSPGLVELEFNVDEQMADSFPPSPTPLFDELNDSEDAVTIVPDLSPATPGPGVKKSLRRSPSVIVISSDDDSDDDLPKPPPRRSNVKPFASAKKETKKEQTATDDVQALYRIGPPKRPGPLERSKVMEGILTTPLSPLSDLTPSTSSQKEISAVDIEAIISDLEDDNVQVIPTKSHKTSVTASSVSRLTPTVSEAGSSTKKSLLVLPKKGQSAAVTRIKKRKTSRADFVGSDDEDEPPLKKARLRTQIQSSKISRVSGTPKETPKQRKTPVKQTASVTSSANTPSKRFKPRAANFKWPQVKKPTFDQSIQCDDCRNWYHVGCVGVKPDDFRLSPGENYQCPPCEAGIHLDANQTPSKKVKKGKSTVGASTCDRPKCLFPVLEKQDDTPRYEVEAFIGLWKKPYGGSGMKTEYLVQWLGYPLNEANWEQIDKMGLSNEAILTTKFEEDAENEGLDLDDAINKPLYLKVASDAGWDSSGLYHK